MGQRWFDNIYIVEYLLGCMRWGLLVLLGVFFVSLAGATVPDDCDSSMIAYWQFENDLGDSVGGYDGGEWTGTSRYASALIEGIGYEADLGGDEKITISKTDDLGFSSAFTIEMWIKSLGSSTSILFEKGKYKIEWVKVTPLTGSINISIGESVIMSDILNATVPHHVAVVWDPNTPPYYLTLYINGTNVDETVMTGAANAGGDLVIGEGFKGLIDELAIYDEALSAGLIGSHYELGAAGKDYCDGGSTTTTTFNIPGCSFSEGSESVGVAKGRCSGDPLRGYFFCGADQEGPLDGGWDTMEAGLGCAMGDGNWEAGDAFCCPAGGNYFCNETDGTFKCEGRNDNCENMVTRGECTADDMACIWWSGTCIPNTDDLGCGDYDRGAACSGSECEDACVADGWNLGKTGIGTEVCETIFECVGELFSVPIESCSCIWYDDAPVGQRCQVNLIGSQIFFDTDNPGSQSKFSCSNVYELDECIDGKQGVEWSSTNSTISGFWDYGNQVPTECLEQVGCAGGESERSCGEPIVKLPGFSLFAFFMSLFIVGMYYFVRGEGFK